MLAMLDRNGISTTILPPLSNCIAKSLLVAVVVPSDSHHLAPAIATADPEPTAPSAAISPTTLDTSFVTEMQKKQAMAFLFGSNEEKKKGYKQNEFGVYEGPS
jgi:hypothetical protein